MSRRVRRPGRRRARSRPATRGRQHRANEGRARSLPAAGRGALHWSARQLPRSETMRLRTALATLLPAALLALTLAVGCKREEPVETRPDLVEQTVREDEADELGARGGRPEVVDVLLTDASVEISGALTPGRTLFRVRNGGTERHSFALDGSKGTARLAEPLEPGASATVEARLPEGLYSVFCPMQGHRSSIPQQVVVTPREPRL